MKKLSCSVVLWLLFLASPSFGQGAPATVKLCIPTSGTACPPVTASAPLPVTGSFSATLSGFTPNGNYDTLTATAASSASTAMPAGTVVGFQNLSAVDVSCVLSAGAATATINKLIVRAGATVYYTVGSNVNAACINQTGSASNVVAMAGGAGLGTNFGGGSGGGGGGGAVTVADGADITQGALADPASTAGGTGSLSAKLRLMTTQLGTLNTTLGSPFQAGGSIGNTAFGISGTVPSPTTASGWGLLAQGATTSGQLGGLVLGAVTTAAPSYTTAQSSPLSLDTAGNLRVNVVAGGAGGGAVYGPTAVGGAAANPPVLAGGTADGTATGLVAVATIKAGNTAAAADKAVLTADANLLAAVNSSIPAGANLIGDVNLRQGGTALSTTNGIYSNLLQGNAVISATNGLYANQLQGNAVLSATNPSFSRPTDGTSARVFDPCEVVAHVTTPISISSAATSVIVAGTSAKKTYICSMMLMSAGTTNVGIVQGSGSTCGTSTLGLIGGATAATGPNLTAQAGFVAGNGNFAIAGTTVNANDICLINSAAIQVSGYVVTATP